MKKIISLSLIVVCVSAFAQESKPVGLSARIGLFLPTAQAAKNAGKQWFGFGLDYKLGDIKYAKEGDSSSASYGISLDYINKNDFRMVPVTYTYTVRTQEGFYYKAGLGVAMIKEPRTGATPGTDSKTAFAYQLGVGMDVKAVSMPAFVEVKYFGSSRSNLNGLGAFFGVRF
ncbi:MAG: outer membrane beta-barrel protein [Armatimonadetes bacterium]|nr:outer membrane beta-barrel protein [Armatimonadota bacterium]